MNRAIIALLGIAVGCALGMVLAFFFVPLKLEWVDAGQANLPIASPPPLMVEEIAMKQATYEPDWQAFEARWAEAPENIRQLARTIAKGAVPEGLSQFEAPVLSQGYRAAALDFTRDGNPVPYLATLLQEAVISYNLEAVHALLAGAVNPNANHSEALFMAIERKTPGAPDFMLFPDFDASLPIVQALIDAGSDPNAQRHGFRHVTPLNLAEGLSNLGAMIMLINGGADPWLRPTFADGKTTTDSFMESISFGAGDAATAEILFRVLRGAKVSAGPVKQVDYMLTQLGEVVETFASGSGPDARHTAWRLHQVLTLLGPLLGRTDEVDRLSTQLTKFDYHADGGWYLAEGELHSRYDAPLSVPDHGDQIWGP